MMRRIPIPAIVAFCLIAVTLAVVTAARAQCDCNALQDRVDALESRVSVIETWKAYVDGVLESLLQRILAIEDHIGLTSTTTTTAASSTTTTTTAPATTTTTTSIPSGCPGSLIASYGFRSGGIVSCPASGYKSCCVKESCSGRTAILAPGQSWSRSCSRSWTADLYGTSSNVYTVNADVGLGVLI